MRSDIKKPKYDLRKYYHIILEFGFIVVLLLLIAATQIEFTSEPLETNITEEQEVVKMEDVTQTKQEEKAPPPPRPQVPVEVPNDEVIVEQDINLDAEMNMDEPLEMPPPPKEEKKEKQEEDFFVAVEQMPELKGSIGELQQKITYPPKAEAAGIEGRVIIQFIVSEDGEVENPRVIRGIGAGCDEEALEVVKTAEFKPGKQRGKPVRVQYSIPITFKLQ